MRTTKRLTVASIAVALLLSRGSVDRGSLNIGVTWQEFNSEPVPGDVVFFGVRLAHSAIGLGATRIAFEAERLVCSNGMTSKFCLDDGRTARIRRGGEQTVDHTLANIKTTATKVFEGVPERMAALENLVEENTKPLDLQAAINRLVEKYRFSRAVGDELRLGIEEGDHSGYESNWGLTNLVTRLATHGPRRSRRLSAGVVGKLEDVAGVIVGSPVHLCKQCRAIYDPSRN